MLDIEKDEQRKGEKPQTPSASGGSLKRLDLPSGRNYNPPHSPPRQPPQPKLSAEEMLKNVREFVVSSDFMAEALLRNIKQADCDELALELLKVFHAEKNAGKIRNIAIAVASEDCTQSSHNSFYFPYLAANLSHKPVKNDPNDLLRGSTIHMTVLSEYIRLVGHQYLLSVVKPHVRLLTGEHVYLEVIYISPPLILKIYSSILQPKDRSYKIETRRQPKFKFGTAYCCCPNSVDTNNLIHPFDTLVSISLPLLPFSSILNYFFLS